MKLFRKDDQGNLVPEEVAPEDVPAAFASGKFGIDPSKPVAGRTADGKIVDVPAEKFHSFLKSGGTIASPKEYDQAVLEHKEDNLGSTAAAAGEGLVRGASLGTSDAAAIAGAKILSGNKFAEQVRKHLAEKKQAHPWASGIAEGVGSIAPAFFTGGESEIATGANLAREGVEAANAARAVEGLTPAAKAAVGGEEALIGKEAAQVAPNVPGITPPTVPNTPGETLDALEKLNGPTDVQPPVNQPFTPQAGTAPPQANYADQSVLSKLNEGLGPNQGPIDPQAIDNLNKLQQAENTVTGKLPQPGQPAPPVELPHPPEGTEALPGSTVAPAKDLPEAANRAASRISGFKQFMQNTPAGLTSRAGRAAEGLAQGAVEDVFGKEVANSTVGRVLTGAVKYGVSGAIENGLITMGNEVSEEALGDENLNGEKILGAFGHGAMVGSAFGAGFGALSGVGSSIVGKLAPSIEHLSELQTLKAFGSAGDRNTIKDAVRKFGSEAPKELKSVAFKYGLLEGAPDAEQLFNKTESAYTKVGEELGNLRGGMDAAVSKVADMPSVKGIMKNLHENERVAQLKEFAGMNRSLVGLSHEEEARLVQLGETLKSTANPEARIAILNEMKGLSNLSRNSEVANLEKMLTEMGGKDGRISFEKLGKFRAFIDDQIPKGSWNRSLTEAEKSKAALLKAARFAIEDELVEAGEKVMGPEKMAEYKALKSDYHKLSFLYNRAEASYIGKLNNHAVSLTGKMLGVGVLAHATHPAGIPAAVATMAAHKLMRDRGNAAAAVVLDKMSQFGFIRKATEGIDKAADSAATAVLKRAEGGEAKVMSKPRGRIKLGRLLPKEQKTPDEPVAARDKATENLYKSSAMSALPSLQAEAAGAALGGIHTQAPKHAGAVASNFNMTVQYLLSQLPKDHVNHQELSGPLAGRVSDQELDEFNRKHEGATDIVGTMQKIQNGRVTQEHIDGMKGGKPGVLQEFRQKVVTKLAEMSPEKREQIPMGSQMEISLILGVPINWAQQPDGLKLLQANDSKFTQSDGRPAGAATPGRPASFKNALSKQMLTPLQKAEDNLPGNRE